MAFGTLPVLLWIGSAVPGYLTVSVSTLVIPQAIWSDLLTTLPNSGEILQRVGLITLAVGFLLLASVVYPRLDTISRTIRTGQGVLVSLLGLGAIILVAFVHSSEQRRIDNWKTFHSQHAGEPIADLKRIEGIVTMRPGKHLEFDFTLFLKTPHDLQTDELSFTLNPGVQLTAIELNGDPSTTFTFMHGLLRVRSPTVQAPSDQVTLRVRGAGVPDPKFAYLDAIVDADRTTKSNYALDALGTRASIFSSTFVAMMPGTHWYPTPGAQFPRREIDGPRHDYFEVDIRVDAPEDWIVVGPGKREEVDVLDQKTSFLFAPTAPVPALALIASRFVKHAIEVNGLEIELLLHPSHLRNVEFFAEAVNPIKEKIRDLSQRLEKAGMGYPYGTFSVVEVPNRLRIYGGGWQLSSAQIQPAMVLMREHSFPTALFEQSPYLTWWLDEEGVSDKQRAERLAQVLYQLRRQELTGGNPLQAAAASLFNSMTCPEGPGAVALDYVLKEITNNIVQETAIPEALLLLAQSRQFSRLSDTLPIQFSFSTHGVRVTTAVEPIHNYIDYQSPSVWTHVRRQALSDLDFRKHPETVRKVLGLKGSRIASAYVSAHGREKATELLGELRSKFAGRSFSLQEFEEASQEVNASFGDVVGNWYYGRGLPGFLASHATHVRLNDTADDSPLYKISFHLRNNESFDGVAHITSKLNVDDELVPREGASLSNRLSGSSSVLISLYATQPFESVRINPYLSLNQSDFVVLAPEVDHTLYLDKPRQSGIVASTWEPPTEPGWIVDDLDTGFSTTNLDASSETQILTWLRKHFPTEIEMDEGLPSTQFGFEFPWSRRNHPNAYGKYRHTFVFGKFSGKGKHIAWYAASLPRRGTWRLEFHQPFTVDRKSMRYSGMSAVWTGGQPVDRPYKVTIYSGSAAQEVEFNAKSASLGWNWIGDFDLESDDVTVSVTNLAPQFQVVMDAIRWTPVSSE